MCDIEGRVVIVGGGIAGVTCAEQLRILCPEIPVVLITASSLVKTPRRVTKVARVLEDFDVEAVPTRQLEEELRNLRVVHGCVSNFDPISHVVTTSCGKRVKYEKLCICTGAKPKLLVKDNPHVIQIRDVEPAKGLQSLLTDAKRVVIVGNGGISAELVYELRGIEIVWAIKDKAVTTTFIDADAAEFLIDSMKEEKEEDEKLQVKRMKYTLQETSPSENRGTALGSDWLANLNLQGQAEDTKVRLELECEVASILTPEEYKREQGDAASEETWPVYVKLTNGHVWGCNLVVSATEVVAASEAFEELERDVECGIIVDDRLRTSAADVYAAGDVCTASWPRAKHWFQMKLWTQARQFGEYAARSMWGDLTGEEILPDFCFELFTHATKFFGFKVIALGLFNGQGLGTDCEVLVRSTKNMDYIKVILQDGKMQGALLIGETDLEEIFENLILNQMDLSAYGEDLLDPSIDLEHYFY